MNGRQIGVAPQWAKFRGIKTYPLERARQIRADQSGQQSNRCLCKEYFNSDSRSWAEICKHIHNKRLTDNTTHLRQTGKRINIRKLTQNLELRLNYKISFLSFCHDFEKSARVLSCRVIPAEVTKVKDVFSLIQSALLHWFLLPEKFDPVSLYCPLALQKTYLY